MMRVGALILSTVVSCLAQTHPTLTAVFTPTPIQVDGHRDDQWTHAAPSDIAICMDPRRTAQLNDCNGLKKMMPWMVR